MGPAIFVMAIMGCGEGDAPCQQVRTIDTQYESQAACTAATGDAVTRHADIDYPVVVAQCQARDTEARLASSDVELPRPEDTPHYPHGRR